MKPTSAAKQLFFNTVKIDTKTAAGGSGTGTGFSFVYSENGEHYPFIVTNKHVVSNAVETGITFITKKDGKPQLGNGFRLVIDRSLDLWHGHPDEDIDVTVIPLAPLENSLKELGQEVFIQPVSEEIIASHDDLKGLDALEEITFIGYPNGLWDSKNLTPIMRKGYTATPIELDFQGRPIFLIDASVFPGSSGSPVFVFNQGSYVKDGNINLGSRLIFVGIVAEVFVKQDLNDLLEISVPVANKKLVTISNQMIDIGVVFKSTTVIETIKSCINKYEGHRLC
ncbi:serine protease [Methylomonas sp. SURF-1]|uniref:Serine protease n=1 Tax=Methylomonas aurea TaxID=2952224 RepID=A0ABT1UFI2_9GAMM|nr:trypsin-like peptidase domain-containing protein [Methylomonas sp. SURF-1]MCQ8180455.1 serine protease [Methylomonas sp. SURF-1]